MSRHQKQEHSVSLSLLPEQVTSPQQLTSLLLCHCGNIVMSGGNNKAPSPYLMVLNIGPCIWCPRNVLNFEQILSIFGTEITSLLFILLVCGNLLVGHVSSKRVGEEEE